MRAAVTIIAAIALLGGSACSGGGDGAKRTSTAAVEATAAGATAAAGAAGANALTAVALQPSDLPAGMAQTAASFSTGYNGDVIVYSTAYSGGIFSISSEIGYAAPGATIDTAATRLRQLQTGLMRLERNYTIEGADQAFAYGHPQATAIATLLLKDGYYVNIIIQAQDKAHLAEALDQAHLDRYTKAVFDRLKAYLADPSSVTPVPGTPRYQPAGAATPG